MKKEEKKEVKPEAAAKNQTQPAAPSDKNSTQQAQVEQNKTAAPAVQPKSVNETKNTTILYVSAPKEEK